MIMENMMAGWRGPALLRGVRHLEKMAIWSAALMIISIPGCSSTPRGANGSPSAVDDAYGERVSPDEDALDKEIADLSVARLREMEAAKKGLMTRAVHAKQHGCVRAKFVIDKDVPAEFRAGVLAEPGKEYAAWIRFSGGSPKIQDDKIGDARGMAVKLMGVGGDKLLESEKEARTQDFLMINHDAFFIKDGKDYVQFLKLAAKDSSPAWFFFGRLPWRWTEFSVALKILRKGKKMRNPLFSPYFSATPYLLGENNVIKFSAQPCTESPDMRNHFAGSPDYLRLNMERSLDVQKGKPACFRFMVQKRADPGAMSVEDSRIPWDQGQSAFVPVATITIPAQEFSSARQMRFCENLSFTPWHSLPEHRPLGNINRARKSVYETASKFRHDSNHEIRREPDAGDNP